MEAGFRPKITNYISRLESMLGMVEKGFGVAFASEEMVRHKRFRVSYVRIESEIPVYIGIVYMKEKELNQRCQQLLDYVQEHLWDLDERGEEEIL